MAALDAVPDPINGLMIYPGRGGSSGARVPQPAARAVAGAGAAPIRVPTSRTALLSRRLVVRESRPIRSGLVA